MEYYKYIRKYVGHEPIMLVGSAVLIYQGSKILLQKRHDNGCWGKHGGVADLYENVENTARRELMEEIGVSVGKLSLLGVYSGKEYTVKYANGDIANYVDVVFYTDELIGTPVPDNNEVDEVMWFDIDDLPESINRNDREPILDLVKLLKERKNAR